MSYDAEAISASLKSSFDQGGLNDLISFALRHARTRRWIIASDFNIGAPGAAHHVFAFAAYPTGTFEYGDLTENISTTIPSDFKRTRIIDSKIKRFFRQDPCFCIVILAPTDRLTMRDHSIHASNLLDARTLVASMLQDVTREGMDGKIIRDIKKLSAECQKKNLSLKLLESLFLFSLFNAFVSTKICSLCPTELVGWFPDQDNITTYADCAWESLAHLNFHGMWNQNYRGPVPKVGVLNHRIKGLNVVYDPLIRIPDFFAATLSRWNFESNKLVMPQGTESHGRIRYRQIVRQWAADNSNLWIGRVFRDKDRFYLCARVHITRSKKAHKIITTNQKNRIGDIA